MQHILRLNLSIIPNYDKGLKSSILNLNKQVCVLLMLWNLYLLQKHGK